MAKQAKAAAGEINPAAEYRVVLNRSVRHGSMWLRPSDGLVMTGAVVQELGDAVVSFEEK